MSGGKKTLRKLALLLALCAGGLAQSAPTVPAAPRWTADPEDQFLLDVTIRQLRLGDGVRAYNAPEGTCVVLGDFLTTLDVPVKVDLSAKKASGWAFREKNRLEIDYAAMRVSYGGKAEQLAPGTIRETPEGWCVQTSALARWFGIGVKPITSGSVLMLQSDVKLPVELSIEREQRAAQIHPARFDLSGLPRVRIPYRMWRTPVLDFVVSGGVTYRANDGARVDRQTSVYAAGEIAHVSYDSQFTTTRKGKPANLRVRAYRSDPDGQLLGPAHATHYGFGDVAGFESRLTGGAANGRGAVITNRPLTTPASFDKTHFEGDLPSGWEAEIYRNDELLAFAKPSSSQRYVFDNVQLLYGENRIRIVLYGPQGQVRTREELVNVGQDNAPPGKTWYWAGFNQPGRDIISVERPPGEADIPRGQATIALEHGIDTRTSVSAIARMMLIDDERVTFVEGTVRRSVGHALLEVGAARESAGGSAAHARLLGKIGPVNVNAEALIANDFHLQGTKRQSLRQFRVGLDAPLKIGHTVLPAHAEARLIDHVDGTKEVSAAARLSASVERFNLATAVRYERALSGSGSTKPGAIYADFIGSGRAGPVRVRGLTTFEASPRARLQQAELSGYWSATDNVDWEGDLVYEAAAHRSRARISHIRRFNSMALALTAEAATDGSVAFGINLNFSLDPGHGFSLSRAPFARGGTVRATVYRDLNDNGVRDPSEPLEKGALVTTGTQLASLPTDTKGTVTVAGLSPYVPVAVGIDESSLADPMLVPKTPLQVVIPRPGAAADVEIGLVGGGDVEGSLLKSGGLGFEGVDVELVDGSGKVAATARTDFDGFFIFERVAYGSYTIRVSQESAAAAKISTDLGVRFAISSDKSVVRLGSITAVPQAHVADAAQVAGPSASFR